MTFRTPAIADNHNDLAQSANGPCSLPAKGTARSETRDTSPVHGDVLTDRDSDAAQVCLVNHPIQLGEDWPATD